MKHKIKNSNCEGKRIKGRISKTHLKLRNLQLKTCINIDFYTIISYNHKKTVIDVHIKKIKESKYNTEDSHQKR